jgi:hypothetical protein
MGVRLGYSPGRGGGGSSVLQTLKVGGAPQSAFTAEMGQDNDGVVTDLSFVRIRARASRGLTSPTSFFGETALRVEIEDTASVVSAATAPYLYGLRVRAVPRVNRTQSGIDDLVGVAVLNKSFADTGTAQNGTEAIYVGWGQGSTGGASKDWNAGVGIDTVADNGMYIVRGPYAYGILMTASFTTAAIRIPNNALIVARNAADSANINVVKLDTSNNVRIGASGTRTVVGAPNADATATHLFEIHNPGFTDGTLGQSHTRVVDTTAFAAGVGAAIGLGGYVDATPTVRTFGGITGRKANGTSGNAGGYLALYSRAAASGLLEVLRLTETQTVQFAEVADLVFGTTTGSKIGTATTQKLGFWGATPIAKPAAITGSRGSATATVLAALLTALSSEGLITDSTTA